MSEHVSAEQVQVLRRVAIRWAVLLAALGLFALWATCRMAGAAGRSPATAPQAPSADAPPIEYWTCTMHPQVQQPEPGKCPICGMQLVPKYAGSAEPGVKPDRGSAPVADARPHEEQAWYRCTMPECGDQGSSDPNSHCPVCGMKREQVSGGGPSSGGFGTTENFETTLSPRALRLAEVESEVVRERFLQKRIRTVGRVGYDETRYKMVSAWIGGRIDKLFADFTGMTVGKGDHLVEIYSPELLSAQEEYLQAIQSAAAVRSLQTPVAKQSSEQVRAAARRKLELLGITDDQIDAIAASGRPQTHLVVHAPIGGTILKKEAMEGMYVDTGDMLYTIADLTHLWLLVDLYESDLPWVKPLQRVRVTTRSLPGEVFTGQIVFIDPRVDALTRTVPVRIHVENPSLTLKPDMWVTAEIESGMTAGGRGAVPRPGGDYACPMHPWESADAPGTCPVCDMALEPVTSLPQYTPPTDPVPILAVPRGAVMQTGERALVYIERTPGTYVGAEVTIGPSAEDASGREYYPVLTGLRGGERVVTRGNFAIDSQMQLAGKPSLFSARGLGGGAGSPHLHATDHEPTTRRSATTEHIAQTQCPVMGGDIDPTIYTDFHGVRVYFCCPLCVEQFREDPRKYLVNLPDAMAREIRSKLDEHEGGA